MTPKKNSPWWTILKVILAIGLTAAILVQVDLQALGALLGKIPLGWLLACGVLYFASNMAKSLQYGSLLDETIPFPKLLQIVTIQNAITNFIAPSAGIASLIASLRLDEGVKVTRSATVFLVTKVMDLLFIGIFCGIASLFTWSQIAPLQSLIIALLAGILLLTVLFLLAISLRHAFAAWMERLLNRFRLQRFSFIQKSAEAVRLFITQEPAKVRRMVTRSFLSSFLFFALTVALRALCYPLFSIPLGWWQIVFITCLLQVISFIPITMFGGLGVNEISFLYLFGLFGLSSELIPTFVIGLRILYTLAVLISLLYLPAYGLVRKIKPPSAEVK